MKIEDAQEMMRKIYFERDRARGVRGTFQRTSEELNELREAILKEKSRTSLEEEIADVFAWLCSLANLLDIDVSEAFYKKYTDTCSKCKQNPCTCPE
ncbi:MAG: MazG nucleotide pyrophosphohydrolase domain-containing protein [Candidatus Odinarchaeota archaeon]